MLKMLYEAMHGVFISADLSLQSHSFTTSSPFPTHNQDLLESLSLIYENCALFADLYLR
jgi:hypothetical protein